MIQSFGSDHRLTCERATESLLIDNQDALWPLLRPFVRSFDPSLVRAAALAVAVALEAVDYDEQARK